MSWIGALFSPSWRAIHLAAILLLCGLLIFNPAGIRTATAQLPLSVLYLPFFKFKSTISELQQVAEENTSLRQRLVESSMRLSMLEESERENNRLKRILGFEPPSGYRLLPAAVVSVAGESLPVRATINRGSDQGIQVNQPVINEEGLVGRISEVTRGFAVIQLLTDPLNRVAVRAAEKRDMGIAKTEFTGRMVIDHISAQTDLQEGELLLTSGLGGVYPKGLLVGRVVSVSRPTDDVFARVELLPAVRFDRIEELFVLRGTDQ